MRSGFAKRLTKLRLAEGLTLRDLAEQSDLSYQRIQHYEHGRSIPNCIGMAKLAVALGTTSGYLLTGISLYEIQGLIPKKKRKRRSRQAGVILSAAAHSLGMRPYNGDIAINAICKYLDGEISDIELYKIFRRFLIDVHPVECGRAFEA